MALSDNLVAYYKLDESSGNASDSVGSRTLTNFNTTTYTTGLINNGISENGSNQYMGYTADNYGIAGGAISISGWVKLNSEISSGTWHLFSQESATNNVGNAIIYEYNGGTRRINATRAKRGLSDNTVTSNTTLGTSAWHHLVYTFDGSTVTIYLDGTSVGTVASSGNGFSGSSTEFSIGRLWNNTNYPNAKFDEVGIWSRAITGSEVTTLYNSGAGKAYPYGTAYSLILSLGTYTYTGFDTLFTRALQMIISVGTYTYTGFDTILKRGMGIVMGVGTYTYTGFDTILTKALTMALAIGTYTYTGFDTALSKGFNLVAQAGSYVYTGFNAILRKVGWDKASKSNTTSWSNRSKSNTSSWTNQTK